MLALPFARLVAQTDLGTVRIRVQDQRGGPIAGASVTLRNPATSWERRAQTDARGQCYFAGVPLTGPYVVSANAHTRDNNSNLGPFTRVSALNPFDLPADGAYSSFDVRNSFNLSAITNLPYGFKFNPVLFVRSGLPYTPIIGLDTQNDGNDWDDRAIVTGMVVPRNIFRQPSFFDLDIRFVKDITLRGEGRHLDLFLDVFNLTGAGNRNFGPEAISVFGTSSAPVFTAGQALFAPDTNHFGSARQVQFTVRFTAF